MTKKFRVVAFDEKATNALVTADGVSVVAAQELIKVVNEHMRDVVGWLTVIHEIDDTDTHAIIPVSLYEYFLPGTEAELMQLLEAIACE